MPKGPNGQKRPADTNSCAVMVAKIATGEVEETMGANRGSEGGKARAESMSAERRAEIAKRAAGARWKKEAIMSVTVESASKRLFRGSTPIEDVKLYPGYSRDVTKEQLADQVVRVVAEMDAGALEVIEYEDDD